jgi:RHS repeat-associated protein
VTITGSTTYTANPLNQYTAITGNPNPTYDADGNLLSGLRSPLSVFTCTWNGENRMLSSTSANVAITDRRVENAYDALGRRVRKTVKFASTGAVIEDRYFIYDGWNVIEETIVPATGPVETAEHVWGTDLSGTAQGAGGVGGLLLRESSANGASYYHYDGNGNVTALTSGTGTVQAAYTYGPFGETLRAVGPLAQANPWRFSTKYQDDETGLLYYGYRFYNPTDGRWMNRDPIGEEGGLNLHTFAGNDPTNSLDAVGLREPGHHLIPWSIFNGMVGDEVQKFFDSDLNRIFNQEYTNHNFKTICGIKHWEYNQAVREALNEFLGNRQLRDLTLEQAKDFAHRIHNAPKRSTIGAFNRGIALEARLAEKFGASALRRALSALGKNAARASIEKAKAKGAYPASLGRGVKVILRGVAIVFAVRAYQSHGVAGVIKEQLFGDPGFGTLPPGGLPLNMIPNDYDPEFPIEVDEAFQRLFPRGTEIELIED